MDSTPHPWFIIMRWTLHNPILVDSELSLFSLLDLSPLRLTAYPHAQSTRTDCVFQHGCLRKEILLTA